LSPVVGSPGDDVPLEDLIDIGPVSKDGGKESPWRDHDTERYFDLHRPLTLQSDDYVADDGSEESEIFDLPPDASADKSSIDESQRDKSDSWGSGGGDEVDPAEGSRDQEQPQPAGVEDLSELDDLLDFDEPVDVTPVESESEQAPPILAEITETDPFEQDPFAPLRIEGISESDDTVSTTCPACGTRLLAKPSQVGHSLKCPDCYTLVKIKSADQQTERRERPGFNQSPADSAEQTWRKKSGETYQRQNEDADRADRAGGAGGADQQHSPREKAGESNPAFQPGEDDLTGALESVEIDPEIAEQLQQIPDEFDLPSSPQIQGNRSRPVGNDGSAGNVGSAGQDSDDDGDGDGDDYDLVAPVAETPDSGAGETGGGGTDDQSPAAAGDPADNRAGGPGNAEGPESEDANRAALREGYRPATGSSWTDDIFGTPKDTGSTGGEPKPGLTFEADSGEATRGRQPTFKDEDVMTPRRDSESLGNDSNEPAGASDELKLQPVEPEIGRSSDNVASSNGGEPKRVDSIGSDERTDRVVPADKATRWRAPSAGPSSMPAGSSAGDSRSAPRPAGGKSLPAAGGQSAQPATRAVDESAGGSSRSAATNNGTNFGEPVAEDLPNLYHELEPWLRWQLSGLINLRFLIRAAVIAVLLGTAYIAVDWMASLSQVEEFQFLDVVGYLFFLLLAILSGGAAFFLSSVLGSAMIDDQTGDVPLADRWSTIVPDQILTRFLHLGASLAAAGFPGAFFGTILFVATESALAMYVFMLLSVFAFLPIVTTSAWYNGSPFGLFAKPVLETLPNLPQRWLRMYLGSACLCLAMIILAWILCINFFLVSLLVAGITTAVWFAYLRLLSTHIDDVTQYLENKNRS